MLKSIALYAALITLGVVLSPILEPSSAPAQVSPFKRTILQRADVPGTNLETNRNAFRDRVVRQMQALVFNLNGRVTLPGILPASHPVKSWASPRRIPTAPSTTKAPSTSRSGRTLCTW